LPYSYLSFGQLKVELSRRLNDLGNVYFTNSGAYNEIGTLLQEAFYTFQSMSGFWRQRDLFNTVASQAFYPLQTYLPALLGFSITDRQLIAEIQYHLLEPADPTTWTGTTMFTLDDLTNSLQRRRNQFLSETGAVLTHSSQVVAPAPIGREALADTFIDVRRVAWKAAAPKTDVIPLWRADEWAYNAYQPGWSVNPATPVSYTQIGTPPLQLQLSPVPIDAGEIDILSVQTGADFTPSASATLLGIPDNLAWVLKWGTLADLFSKDGEARDNGRATYCEQRWQEGCELARQFVTVVQAEINGLPVFVQSLADLDAFFPSWGVGTGSPTNVSMAGLNMLGVARVPDAGPYSITLDVVRNAPVPVLDADLIQIGREVVDAILGYAQHLAMLKQGGVEFQQTIPLYQNFVRQAAIYNDKLKAQSVYLNAIEGQSTKQGKQVSRRESDEGISGGL
jgi:hypothetical protein